MWQACRRYTLKDTILVHLIRDDRERDGDAAGRCELDFETFTLDNIVERQRWSYRGIVDYHVVAEDAASGVEEGQRTL